jgi:hypothetical protein
MSQEELSSAEKQAFMATAIILSEIDDNEPFGAMGSDLYAAVTGIRCPLECFTEILSALVASGVLERHGSCYCRSTRLSANAEMSLCE